MVAAGVEMECADCISIFSIVAFIIIITVVVVAGWGWAGLVIPRQLCDLFPHRLCEYITSLNSLSCSLVFLSSFQHRLCEYITSLNSLSCSLVFLSQLPASSV